MSGFAAALKGRPPTKKGPPCSVGEALDLLEPEDRIDAIQAMMDLWKSTKKYTARDIADVLNSSINKILGTEYGDDEYWEIKPQTIRRHSRHDCSCDR